MLRFTLTSVVALVALGLAFGPFVQAQQPAQPPPPWKQGQPASMADSPLAPIAQPPAPKAPGEIPVDKIKVPAGFKVSLWAHGINNARAMTWGDKGTLFVSSRVAGNVYAVVDKGASREVKLIAKGLTQPNGVAFKNGTLYIAEISPITKMDGIEDKLDNPPAVDSGLRHRCRRICRTAGSTWPSDPTASSTSTSARRATSASRPTPTPTSRASIRTAPASSTGRTASATVSASTGIRSTKDLYFTTHARDWLGEDVPSDRFDQRRRRGCTSASRTATRATSSTPSSARGAPAASSRRRSSRRGRTWPATACEFYTGSMFPAEYKNRAFLAQRGSWNRTQKIGFRVMMVTSARATCRSTSRSPRAGCRATRSGAARSTRSR